MQDDVDEVDKKRQAKERKREAEAREVAANEPLTENERVQVSEHRRLSSRTVYAIVLAEGEEELSRPNSSLLGSGVAAGIGISASVLAEGTLRDKLGGHPYRELIENMGYTVGFIIVILSRLQLFTENTVSVVLPLLFRPSRRKFLDTARLWGIVLAANFVGTALTAAVTYWGGVVPPEILHGMLSVSADAAHAQGMRALLLGVPAGFFIAAVVWMLPSSRGFEIFVIFLFTYLIALCHFAHVVAGSTEIFLLIFDGSLSVWTGVGVILLPTLVGNIIGGTGLFAVLAHAQVSGEV